MLVSRALGFHTQSYQAVRWVISFWRTVPAVSRWMQVCASPMKPVHFCRVPVSFNQRGLSHRYLQFSRSWSRRSSSRPGCIQGRQSCAIIQGPLSASTPLPGANKRWTGTCLETLCGIWGPILMISFRSLCTGSRKKPAEHLTSSLSISNEVFQICLGATFLWGKPDSWNEIPNPGECSDRVFVLFRGRIIRYY